MQVRQTCMGNSEPQMSTTRLASPATLGSSDKRFERTLPHESRQVGHLPDGEEENDLDPHPWGLCPERGAEVTAHVEMQAEIVPHLPAAALSPQAVITPGPASVVDILSNEALECVAMRVVMDHIRSICFCIADGQIPSNGKAG